MNDVFKQKFGNAVRKRRIECGLSKQRFALMVGMNRLTLHNIESGKANPTLDVLLRIADGLDVSLSSLAAEGERDE